MTRDDIAPPWQEIDPDTHALEIPGLGVIVRSFGATCVGMVFVPGARVAQGEVQRDTRAAPPLSPSKVKQGRPDPGAEQFFDLDAPEY